MQENFKIMNEKIVLEELAEIRKHMFQDIEILERIEKVIKLDLSQKETLTRLQKQNIGRILK